MAFNSPDGILGRRISGHEGEDLAFNSPDGIPKGELVKIEREPAAFNSPDGILRLTYANFLTYLSFNSPDGIHRAPKRWLADNHHPFQFP